MEAVNSWLDKETGQELTLTSAHDPQESVSGGYKYLQSSIAMAAFNHVSDKQLKQALRSHKWEDPGSVRLFVHREDDDNGFSELVWREHALDLGEQSAAFAYQAALLDEA